MDKIARVSKKFRVLFQVLFYLIPILVLWFWVVVHSPYDLFSPLGFTSHLVSGPITVNALTRILGFLVSTLPYSIMMYCLYQLIQIFKNYEKGQIFVLNNVNCYRKLGYALFAKVVAGMIYDPLISIIMTFQNPPHHRLISISFSGADFATLLTGGVILLISWVMKEAHNISTEQELTI